MTGWDEEETIDQTPIDVPPLRQSPESRIAYLKRKGKLWLLLALPVVLLKGDKVKARDILEAILAGDK